MSEQEQRYEIIERYLRHEMSEEERRDFTSRMDKDQQLRQEVALHQELEEVLGDPSYERLRGIVNDIEATPSNMSDRKSRFIFPGWMPIAASLLLLVAASLVIYITTQNSADPENLYAQHFTPYPADAFRSDDATMLSESLRAYQEGQFKEFLDQTAQLSSDSLNSLINFYRGNAFLALGNGEEAALIYENLKKSNSLPGFFQSVEWYLALAYLKAGEKASAVLQLQSIAEDVDHYKYEEAKEMLNALQ